MNIRNGNSLSLYDIKNKKLFAIFRTVNKAGRYVFGKTKQTQAASYMLKQTRSLGKSNMLGFDVAFRYTAPKDADKLQPGEECWIADGYQYPDWNINMGMCDIKIRNL